MSTPIGEPLRTLTAGGNQSLVQWGQLVIDDNGPARPRLLQVPYDSGIFGSRMGAGPLALVGAGAATRLSGRGHAVQEQVLGPPSTSPPVWRAELVTAFELHRVIASAVAPARAGRQVPLLLSRSSGRDAAPRRRLGLVWLDAHGDFNAPETDTTGFLDGHGLAMAAARPHTPAMTAPRYRRRDSSCPLDRHGLDIS